MLRSFFEILRKPFVELAGTPVSVLSLLTALLVVVAAHFISRIFARSLVKAFHHHAGVGFTVAKITRWAGMVVGVLIALTTVGLNMSAVFAAMAVLLVGIGFGLQKMAENFISGLILLIERPLSIGDFIQVDAFKGTVKDIGLRATKIETEEGLMHLIPNGELITKTVTNYTLPSQSVEITVQVGVAYEVDLAMVRTVLREIAASSPGLCKSPAPEVRLQEFGDSSVNLALEAWIERAHEDDDIKSDLRFAIAAKFAELGIEIPYPQRDVRMRSVEARLPPLAAQPTR